MKTRLTYITILFGLINLPMIAQKVYPVTSGEILFSQSSAAFTQEFMNEYPNARLADNNVRFTVFFHLGQYFHMDFTDKIGMYSGLGIRNVGMITDESLPQTVSDDGGSVPYTDYKIIRRQYMLGVPLAIKIGSFKNHFFAFAGGEYELAFHFKEKYWIDTFDRSGSKTKNKEWFANQTPTFFPSVFVGVQFPGGVNLKFKYYLTDFLNTDYKVSNNSQNGSTFSVSDLSRYQSSQLISFSLCWQFNTSELWNWNRE